MGYGEKYTPEQLEFLDEISCGKSNKEITKLFNEKFNSNRTETAISATRKRYGIKTGVDATFKKGHAPWNKGLKGYIGPNRTSFKKGNIPFNYRPVGSTRINVEGYEETKIKDPNIWEYTHVLLWQKHNGPVEKGYNIMFKDGDRANIAIENLEKVSDRELLVLNRKKLISKNPQHTEVGINIARLNIAVSERKKKR